MTQNDKKNRISKDKIIKHLLVLFCFSHEIIFISFPQKKDSVSEFSCWSDGETELKISIYVFSFDCCQNSFLDNIDFKENNNCSSEYDNQFDSKCGIWEFKIFLNKIKI